MNSSTSAVDIRPDHLAIVQDILRAHLPAEFEVWVFGSRATWTTKDSSDLDLALTGPSKLDSRIKGDLEIAFEESDLPCTVDIVDLNAVSPEFKNIVDSQKVLLLPNRGRLNAHREWRETPLGEVIEFKRGYDLPQRNRLPGHAPVVSSSGITDWHSEPKVKGPGVVTGRYGTLGKIYFIQDDFWPLNTALYVRDFKGNDPRFVAYFLRGLDFFAYSDKAAVPGLNRNHLHEAIVRYPTDIGEQRAIAHILGTLDDKIELNRRMNQTLEAMARAIFQDWFVDFGPVRAKMEGQAPYLPPELWDLFPDDFVDSELGEIPQGWEVKPLEQFVDLNPREPLKKGTLAPYLDMGALPTTGSTTDPPVLRDFTSGTRFRNGDALLARITPCLENGKTGFVQSIPEGVAGWGSTEFIVMRSIPPVPSEFAYLLARDSGFRSHAIQSMTGTSGRQRVQTEALASYSLPCPPVDYWEAFGSVAKETFEKVKSNRDEIANLTAQRDLLLPKLVSGQWNIGDF